MLHEIAITPNVFLPDGYSSPDVCEAHMQGLRTPLLEWCMIRDLRAGEWTQFIDQKREEMPNQAKELWKRLLKRKRLCSSPPSASHAPSSDSGWCSEALGSHQNNPFMGILASNDTKADFKKEALVASVERRTASAWWKALESGHPDGHESGRKLADYQLRLNPILRYANSLMFIDPHLDPTRRNYSEFMDMIHVAFESSSKVSRIEIHRCCYEGSGPNRNIVNSYEWEQRFRKAWDSRLQQLEYQIEVFIWPNVHDRHLISNLIGIHMGNGFDTNRDVNAKVSWSRMSNIDRDNFQREFDPAVNAPSHRFIVG